MMVDIGNGRRSISFMCSNAISVSIYGPFCATLIDALTCVSDRTPTVGNPFSRRMKKSGCHTVRDAFFVSVLSSNPTNCADIPTRL